MEELHIWFKENQRSFPWRERRDPYRVWISEVMLQQTRSSVVVPYFLRWMNQFPDVATLANASLETVIKAWEGLGYYSRAEIFIKERSRCSPFLMEKFHIQKKN